MITVMKRMRVVVLNLFVLAGLMFAPASPAAAASTTLVISEVQTRSTLGDAAQEFVELFNGTNSAMPAGWKVEYRAGSGSVNIRVTLSNPIPAQSFVVISTNN